MKGSPGGLARIDRLFGSQTYTIGFSNAPVVFGAFPSLHSACATIEALFISHFFPQLKPYAWGYAAVLFWATMYLTHHYLIDVVSGACLAIACFYFFMPEELKNPSAMAQVDKYRAYGLDGPTSRSAVAGDSDLESDEDFGEDITYRSPRVATTVPDSATPMIKDVPSRSAGRNHRKTASIASLIGPESRVELGWRPDDTA
jgi:inositol phosphorylceramide synthase catalytic subunit